MIEAIEHHRRALGQCRFMGPAWFHHQAAIAAQVRKWREINTLTVVACQIADKEKPAD